MKDYAVEKVSKIEKFINRIIEVNVIMDVQKMDQRVDIVLVANHVKIKSHAITNDMYASIDKAVEKIERQLIKYKDKLRDHFLRAPSAFQMNVEVLGKRYEEDALDGYEEVETFLDGEKPNQGDFHHIVKKESKPLKMLTYDEAVMKMELSKDPFMVFKNEDDLLLKIIYRRSDGHYGILEPQA